MIQSETNLTPTQLKYVEYVSFGRRGEDGTKITMSEFAQQCNVTRATLYRWQNDIPNFWSLVQDRLGNTLIQSIPDIMFSMREQALKGDVQAAKLLLNQISVLKPQPKSELAIDQKQSIQVEIVNYSSL